MDRICRAQRVHATGVGGSYANPQDSFEIWPITGTFWGNILAYSKVNIKELQPIVLWFYL